MCSHGRAGMRSEKLRYGMVMSSGGKVKQDTAEDEQGGEMKR